MSGRRNSNRGLIGGDYSSTGGIQGLVFHEQSKRGGYGDGGDGGNEPTVLALFVAGGGGSSGAHTGTAAVGAGGAGAGGIVEARFTAKTNIIYDITVGSGGTASTGTNTTGTNGGDTKLTINSSALDIFTAKGGGGGGFYDPGSPGGCGGSHGYGGGTGGNGTTQTDPAFIGKSGGTYIDNNNITVDSASQYGTAGYSSSPGTGTGTPGGGGATESGPIWGDNAVHGSNSNRNGGDGGDGLTWEDGNSYAGGGAGTAKYNYSSYGGTGGLGGGGDGGDVDYGGRSGTDGTANTGGGGGGGVGNGSGGNGGSGIAVLYTTGAFTSTTGSPAVTTVSKTIGSNTYTYKYVFTGNGSITV